MDWRSVRGVVALGCAALVAATTIPAAATPVSAAEATPVPSMEATPAQEPGGGWSVTGQAGAGLSFFFGEQVSDPAFGFAVGRHLTDSMQVEGQVLGFAGPWRETTWVTRIDADAPATFLRREQRRGVLALTRANLFLGKGRLRPYFSFGAGIGWGREVREGRILAASLPGPTPGFGPERDVDERIGFVTLLGTGVDIGLSDRWRLRPEALLPLVWGGVESGNVTMVVGVTYASAPEPDARARGSQVAAAVPLPAGAVGWQRVTALPPGQILRVRLESGILGFRDGMPVEPGGRRVIGALVAADDDSIVVRVAEGAGKGTWRFPRPTVERIERGRLETDGPWEGILAGFAVGAGFGAIGYLASGGGDDHEIWIPAGTLLFGAPLALVGGISDHLHRSFKVIELIYDAGS